MITTADTTVTINPSVAAAHPIIKVPVDGPGLVSLPGRTVTIRRRTELSLPIASWSGLTKLCCGEKLFKATLRMWLVLSPPTVYTTSSMAGSLEWQAKEIRKGENEVKASECKLRECLSFLPVLPVVRALFC